MANWISSKLKVAETFLQQIDQQAAESLRKNDNPRSEESGPENPRKISGLIPLKDQLKKKKDINEINEKIGLRGSNVAKTVDPNAKNGNFSRINRENKFDNVRPEKSGLSGNVKPLIGLENSGFNDGDWTELLGVPSQPTSPAVNRQVAKGGGVRRSGFKKGNSSSNVLVLKNGNSGARDLGKTESLSGIKVKDESFDGVETRVSENDMGKVELGSEVSSNLDIKELDEKKESSSQVVENKNDQDDENDILESSYKYEDVANSSQLSLVHESTNTNISDTKTGDGASELKSSEGNMGKDLKGSVGESNGFSVRRLSFSSLNALKKKLPLVSDDRSSSSETGSSSSSDSESEGEKEVRRRKRAEILAERAAAKAVEAIKEKENLVARLEGEKESLEKILEERVKQQALEASELQNTTTEMMDAVDLEKEKHKNTRMEALGRLAKLETTNADLARSLAAAQWNLEIEINRVAEIRQLIESKEASQEEFRRKISATHESGNQVVATRGVEFKHEIIESEYTFVTEKIRQLQEKAKTLEMNIEVTRKEIEVPTEVELELKRRLGQLTDHLIQKQSQVESLSSEKATLAFRIEAVSRLLDENKTMLASTSNRDDLESGTWEFPNSKLRPMFKQRIQSGREHFGLLVRQLDSIYCAGALYLRRNSTAKIWSLIYLVCLHLWVVYILMSHSPVSDESRSGAVFSLENINNTGGV